MKIFNRERRRQTLQLILLFLLFLAASMIVTSAVNPEGDPKIVLEQRVDSTSPRPGDKVNFNISYSNPTSSVAYNATIFEWIPEGLIFIASKPFHDGVSNPEEGFLRWSRGNVGPDEAGTIIVSVTVDNVPVGTSITNTVHLAYEYENGTTVEITSSISIIGSQRAGVDVYSDQIHGVQPNKNAETSYNITVTNKGNARDVFNISLSSLAFNPTLAEKEWTIELYNSTGYLVATLLDDAIANHSSWTNWGTLTTVSLESGQSTWFIIRVVEPGGISGSGDAYIKVRLTATSQFDPSVSDTAETITVVRKAVGITISPDYAKEAELGEIVTYLHEIYNGGGWGGSNQTEVIDLNYTSPLNWTYSFYFMNSTALGDTDNSGFVDVGSVAKDQSLNILVKVTVPYGTAAGITDNAVITARGVTSGRFDTANDNTTVKSTPLIGVIKKLVSIDPAYVGNIVTYRINATNLGNTKLAVVPLDDAFETTSLDFYSANPSPNSHDEIAGTIGWENLTSLEPLQSTVVTINFTAVAGDETVREGAYVIDAIDQFGNLVSAIYVNTELTIIQPFNLTITAFPPEAQGGTFKVTYTKGNVTYANVQKTTNWTETVDADTIVAISDPQEYFPSEAGSDGFRHKFDHYDPAVSVAMTENKTITLIYKTQYSVTFNQSGLDETATGAVVTISGVAKTKSDLLLTDWFDSVTPYSYSSIVSSNVVDKRFSLNGVTGPTSPITSSGTVTGNYIPQYKVTFTQVGLDDTATGTIITVAGTPKGYDDLPFTTDWLDHDTSLGFEYMDTVTSSASAKRFELVNISHESPFTITAPTTVTSTYKIEYKLTVRTEGLDAYMTNVYNGSNILGTATDATPYEQWFHQGTLIQLNIDTPITGGSERKVFTHWTEDAIGTNIPVPVTLDSAKAVTANYKTQYQLTVRTSGLGAYSTSVYDGAIVLGTANDTIPYAGWFEERALVSLNIDTPIINGQKRFVFTQWSGNATGTARPFSITMDTANDITANYKTQYKIIITATPNEALGGTFNVTYTQCGTTYTEEQKTTQWTEWVDADTTVTVSDAQEFVPNETGIGGVRHKFDSSDPSASVTMTGAKTITLVYKTQYYLTVKMDPEGLAASASPQSGWHYNCTWVMLTAPEHANATDETRYRFGYWDIDGITAPDNPTTVHMNASKTATAHYALQYTVTFNQTGLEDSVFDTVVTVETNELEFGDLPYKIWIDKGTEISYNYERMISSTVSGKRFSLINVTGPSSPLQITEPVTIVGNYKTQFEITFEQDGIGGDVTGRVVTIDEANYDRSGASFWWDGQSAHNFSFHSPLVVIANEKRYVWNSTSGLSDRQTDDSFKVTGPGTITGNYKVQYYLTLVTPHGTAGGEGWYYDGATAYATVAPLIVPGPEGVRYTFTHWSGDASGTTSPSDPMTMNSPKIATANWKTQHHVTFTQTGLDSTATGTVVTVNGTAEAYAGLPYSLWVNSSDSLVFSYEATVPSSDSGKRFRLDIVNATSPLTVPEPVTITGIYKTQYKITFAQSGVASDFAGTIVTMDGTDYGVTDLPKDFWWDNDTSHDFAFQLPLIVASNAKQYVWNSTSGLSSLQSSSATVSKSGTVTGNYKTQYYLAVVSPHGTPSGEGWFYEGTDAYAGLDTSIIDHGNGTRRVFVEWGGDATGTNHSRSDPIFMNAPKTAMTQWKTQYLVSFTYRGSSVAPAVNYTTDIDPTETVPFSIWVRAGSEISYKYQEIVLGTPGVKYVFTGVNPESPQTVNDPLTITGTYKTQYYLTMSTNFGTVSPGSGWHDAGSTVSISAMASSVVDGERYVWFGWTGTGTGCYLGMESPASVTMNSPITQTASWEHEYRLTIATNFGTTSPPTGEHWYEAGTPVNFQSFTPPTIPDERFVWNGWTGYGDGSYSGVGNPAFVTMTGPIIETASWTRQFYLTVNSLYANVDGQGWYNAGSSAYATLAARIVFGGSGVRYVFIRWSGDALGTDLTSDPVIMDRPKTAVAHWKTEYYLTLATNPSDITKPTGEGWYDADTDASISTVQHIEIADSSRYWFDGWTTSDLNKIHDYSATFTTVRMDKASTVVANYITQFKLIFDASLNVKLDGTGIIAYVNDVGKAASELPFSEFFSDGQSVSYSYVSPVLSAVDGKRYRWDSISGLGQTLQSSTFTITESGTLTSSYITQFKLTITSAHNSPEPAVGEHWYDAGTSITASVTSPADDDGAGTRYRCTGWIGTESIPASGTDVTVTFTLNEASSITWNWKAQYLATFKQAGLDASASGTVLIVNESAKTYGNLPFSEWIDENDQLTYGYENIVSSSEAGKRFRLQNVTGPASPLTVTGPVTVSGNYVTQYYLTVNTNPSEVLTLNPAAVSGEGWCDVGVTAIVNAIQLFDKVADQSRYDFRYWTGASPTGIGNQAEVVVDSPKTATANYRLQYKITFDQIGVGSDFTGAIVRIDGTNYDVANLPKPFWWDNASTHDFAFNTPLTIGVKRYVWTSTSGLSSSPSGSITVAVSESIIASYKTQSKITFDQTGIDLDFVGTVVTIDGTPCRVTDLPESFWWDKDSFHTFAYQTPLIVASNEKRYMWNNTSGLSSSRSGSITVSASGNIIGNYKTQYYLTVTSPHGNPTPTSDWFDAGREINALVTSPWPSSATDTRYICTGLTGTGSASSSGTTTSIIFIINEPSNVIWNWKTQYYLTMSTNFGTVSPGSGWYDEGAIVIISAEPPQIVQGKGYAWHGWTGKGTESYSGLDNPASMTVNSPITETAYWKILTELTIFVSEETIAKCDRIAVYGTAEPVNSSIEAEVTYTFPNGVWITHKVQTDDEGRYNDTLLLTEEPLYGIFAQGGQWIITASRLGDVNQESATSSTTLEIEAAELPQIPSATLALLIVIAVAICYIIIEKRMSDKKLTYKTWWQATVILGLTGLAFGSISLAFNWMSVAGTATANGETYLVGISLHPFTIGSVSITEMQYTGSEIPSLISSAWSTVAKSPGPIITLCLAPLGCILGLASIYKPKTNRQKAIKILTLVIAGALILVPVAHSSVFLKIRASTTTGATIGYGVGLYAAVIGGLLTLLSSLFANRETPTEMKRARAS